MKAECKYIVATADVSSLYTIINHEDAIAATKWAMDKYSILISKQKLFILRCLAYGLQHNYFWHNHDYYRQLNGVGMGAKYAPSVANIFMAKWEEQAIYSDIPEDLVLYRRFIDDCVVIWKGDESSLIGFFERLNNNQNNIKLTYEISYKMIHFLDLTIQVQENSINTKTFFKTVERNSCIPVDNYHHDPWLINIPKGQMVRFRRNCSEDSTFLEQAKVLGKRFVLKGYNEDFIEEKIKEVFQIPRNTLLQDKDKKNL